jgi:hypothetical protein
MLLRDFGGKPVEDYSTFNKAGRMIYNREKLYQSNNTFKE